MTDNLPELPEQDEVGFPSKDDTNERYYYSGEAMRSYALTAIASERARADTLHAELDIARGLVKDAEDAELEYKERADALEAALQAIVEYNNTMPDDGSWAELMADARSLLEKTNDR